MMSCWKRSFRNTVTTLGAAVLLSLGGCGGEGESIDEGTVTLPEPIKAAGASTTAAPSAGTAEPAAKAEPKATPESTAETAAVKAEGWGTLKGRVTFSGNPPSLKALVTKGDSNVKDAQVCAVKGVPSQRLEVDAQSKGVKDVIVYIPKATAVNDDAVKAARAANVEFDQSGCMFKPHVVAVMKGTKVNIKSEDGVGHNVNFKLINLRQNFTVQQGQVIPLEPKAAEQKPGEVVCDIHPWMKAWWLVSNNPYYAVTDKDGNFEIKNVPAGTQKVVVWQEAATPGGFVTPAAGEAINIKAGGETTKDFTIDASKVKGD